MKYKIELLWKIKIALIHFVKDNSISDASRNTLKMPCETVKIYLHKVLKTLYLAMLQNSQTPFKNPAAFAARFLKCVQPFHNTAKQMVKYTWFD